MGGYTPPAGASASDIWAYATRLLTNLSNIRAGYIDLLADGTVGLAALQTLLSAIPTTPELEADAFTRYANLAVALALIPTTPELEADALVRYNALVAAIGGIPTTPELEANALARYNTLAGYVDEEKNKEHETEWNTNPIVDNVTSLALTTLTGHTISAADFVYPTGATERRVILLAMISAQAQGDATHHIGITVQREINDGGWATIQNLTANPPLGLSAEASMANLVLPYDISAWVASGNKLEFRFQVDSDDAGSVNYTTSFIVILVYRMAA